jgi:hypothetical protein
LLAVIWGCARRRLTPSRSPWGLYHGGLLVHRVDVVRQPCGDAGSIRHRYVRRHPDHRCRGSSRVRRQAPSRRRHCSAGWFLHCPTSQIVPW